MIIYDITNVKRLVHTVKNLPRTIVIDDTNWARCLIDGKRHERPTIEMLCDDLGIAVVDLAICPRYSPMANDEIPDFNTLMARHE